MTDSTPTIGADDELPDVDDAHPGEEGTSAGPPPPPPAPEVPRGNG